MRPPLRFPRQICDVETLDELLIAAPSVIAFLELKVEMLCQRAKDEEMPSPPRKESEMLRDLQALLKETEQRLHEQTARLVEKTAKESTEQHRMTRNHADAHHVQATTMAKTHHADATAMAETHHADATAMAQANHVDAMRQRSEIQATANKINEGTDVSLQALKALLAAPAPTAPAPPPTESTLPPTAPAPPPTEPTPPPTEPALQPPRAPALEPAKRASKLTHSVRQTTKSMAIKTRNDTKLDEAHVVRMAKAQNTVTRDVLVARVAKPTRSRRRGPTAAADPKEVAPVHVVNLVTPPTDPTPPTPTGPASTESTEPTEPAAVRVNISTSPLTPGMHISPNTTFESLLDQISTPDQIEDANTAEEQAAIMSSQAQVIQVLIKEAEEAEEAEEEAANASPVPPMAPPMAPPTAGKKVTWSVKSVIRVLSPRHSPQMSPPGLKATAGSPRPALSGLDPNAEMPSRDTLLVTKLFKSPTQLGTRAPLEPPGGDEGGDEGGEDAAAEDGDVEDGDVVGGEEQSQRPTVTSSPISAAAKKWFGKLRSLFPRLLDSRRPVSLAQWQSENFEKQLKQLGSLAELVEMADANPDSRRFAIQFVMLYETVVLSARSASYGAALECLTQPPLIQHEAISLEAVPLVVRKAASYEKNAHVRKSVDAAMEQLVESHPTELMAEVLVKMVMHARKEPAFASLPTVALGFVTLIRAVAHASVHTVVRVDGFTNAIVELLVTKPGDHSATKPRAKAAAKALAGVDAEVFQSVLNHEQLSYVSVLKSELRTYIHGEATTRTPARSPARAPFMARLPFTR